MNYQKLKKIKKMQFGCEDIAKALGVALASAKVSAARLVKNGIIVRIKRNIYVLKDRWDSFSREDKFVLANLIQVPSYVSLMSAMDYYEITTQVQRDFIESVAVYRTKELEIENNIFNYSKINKGLYFGFVKERGFFIATPEKAFLDALYFMSLKRYNFDISSIDFDKLNIKVMRKMMKKYPPRTQKLLERYGYFKKT